MVVLDTVYNQTFLYNFKNGLLDGYAYLFKEQDTIAKAQYKLGKKSGVFFIKKYGLTKEANYSDGLINGKEITSDCTTKTVIKFTNYVNGKKEGIAFWNHTNGILENYIIYRNGEIVDGKYYSFDYDGYVKGFFKYRNGKLKKRKYFR